MTRTTTPAPALSRTYQPYSNSEVTLTTNLTQIKPSGPSPNQFGFFTYVVLSIPTRFEVDYQPAIVCADGAPTVTWTYVGADSAWHTTTGTGAVSGVCIKPGGVTVLGPLYDEEIGNGPTFQVKAVSVSLRLTGPDGVWTATG